MHRVTHIPEHQAHDRYSIAFFGQPAPSTPLTAIPSKIIPKEHPVHKGVPKNLQNKILTSGDYLQLRLNAAYQNSNQVIVK